MATSAAVATAIAILNAKTLRLLHDLRILECNLFHGRRNLGPCRMFSIKHDITTVIIWVAVKELKLSYHIGETLLLIYTHYGYLI